MQIIVVIRKDVTICQFYSYKRGNIMQQSQYKSNVELKFLAKIQTSKHLGILLGAIFLSFIIPIVVSDFVSVFIPGGTVGYVVNYVLVLIIQIVASALTVGVSFIFLKSACDMPSSIADLFYGFQSNFTKILKIGAIIVAIESICMIPSDFASMQLTDIMNSTSLFNDTNVNDLTTLLMSDALASSEFLEEYTLVYGAMMKYSTITLVCTVLSSILTLPFFPAFYMVIDFPDWNVSTILKRSFEVMKGHKLRLFMLYLSFIPLYLLSMFTCGLALIWVIPYQKMTLTNFYLNLMAVRNKNRTI